MGAVLNTLALSETDKLSNISPHRADWLTSHADTTGLAVVEVERLWNRFKQLTGSNDQTMLNPDHTVSLNEPSNDVFVKNLLKHFPRSKTNPDYIPFGYFVTVVQWFEMANNEDKLRAIFLYVNNGDPIDAVMISKLLKHIYRETREDEIKILSQQLMQQLGSNENGKLTMQQFVTGVQRAIPENELNELLKFEMIPAYLLDQASALPSLPGSSTNIRTTNDFGIHDLVTDDQLRQIANQAQYKNWPKLALTLGFLEYDIEAYKIKNNNDSAAAMLELLRIWREQEASLATKNRLRRYLEQSGLEELVSLLY